MYPTLLLLGFDGMEPPNDQKHSEINAENKSSSKVSPPFTSTIPRNMDPTKINRDRFFLILGIATEALCSPTSTQPDAGERASKFSDAIEEMLRGRWR